MILPRYVNAPRDLCERHLIARHDLPHIIQVPCSVFRSDIRVALFLRGICLAFIFAMTTSIPGPRFWTRLFVVRSGSDLSPLPATSMCQL